MGGFNPWFAWDYMTEIPVKNSTDFVDYMQRKRKEILSSNRDWVHAIIGEEGMGKSQFGLLMCSLWDKDFESNMQDRMVYNIDSLESLHSKGEHGIATMIDEAIFVSHSRAAMSGKGVRFVESIASTRYLNNFVCLCIPRLSSLDPYLRDHRLRTVSWCVDQGKVWFYGKSNYPRVLDWENRKNLPKKRKPKIRPKPDFKTYPKELIDKDPLWHKYKDIRSDRIKNRYKSSAMQVNGYTSGDIAKRYGVSIQTGFNYIQKAAKLEPDCVYSLPSGKKLLKKDHIEVLEKIFPRKS